MFTLSTSALVVSEDEKKRQQAIAELINTEETYVNDMVVALEVCLSQW